MAHSTETTDGESVGIKKRFENNGSRHAINGEAAYVAPVAGGSYSGQTTSLNDEAAPFDGLAGPKHYFGPDEFTDNRLEGANGLASIPIPDSQKHNDNFGDGHADSETSVDFF